MQNNHNRSKPHSYAYINENGQEALLNYSYSGSDSSVLSALLQPYWRYCVQLLPLWMAPNLVTLIGFLVMFSSFLLVLFYINADSLENTTVPSWVFIWAAVSVFFYQTMDAIDGKQARRTNSSTALGELFDHGLDSLSTMIVTVLTAVALNVGNGWFSLLAIFVTYLSAYLFFWEEYFTGILRFGKFHSPTEIQFLSISVYLITAWNPSIWRTELNQLISLFSQISLPSSISHLSLNVILLSGLIVFGIVGIILNAITIQKDGGGLYPSRIFALFPSVFFTSSIVLWAYFSPSNIVETQIVFLCIICGLVFAYMSSRMVVDRVCKQSLTNLFYIHLVFPIAAANAIYGTVFDPQNEPLINEILMLYIALGYIMVIYAHFCYRVIIDICDLLNIRCFHIKPVTKNE
eukprot:gb/GECH01010258.1/.p1 GENE.gb/GECH01010258.1/~~gb/GECH01010258.1/.p1  ORF type:complete len:405 (+),score=42.80 gb/GECH01010258.1/:1-1215(+)